MTTNSCLGRMGGAARLLSLALLFAGGCFNSDGNGGAQNSSGSHWLECSDDGDCAAHGKSATCDGDGFCVTVAGERITVGGAAGTTAGGGSGTSGGTGTGGTSGTGDCSGAIPEICKTCAGGGCGKPVCMNGSYEFVCPEDGPCAAKKCGDDCTECGPAEDCQDKTCDASGTCVLGRVSCGGAADAGMGVAYPDCASLGASEGTMCSGPADQAAPACCGKDGTHLQCNFAACTASIPGSCSGTFEPVSGSTACGGSGSYEPCAAKNCGDTCMLCDPNDKTCVETADLKVCTGTGGMCISGAVDCSPPESCDLDAATNPCGSDQACCAVGRCGPLPFAEGQCEAADPATGGCKPCACEMEPGGCPICNSPDTPILTPTGERAIADLREGDLVLSMHHGMLVAVPVMKTRQVQVHDHAVVRLVFDNGSQVEISGSHPTADGGRLDALVPGDMLGDTRVLSAEMVPYTHDRTYDILPASDTGTYVAGGALIGSTLMVPGVE